MSENRFKDVAVIILAAGLGTRMKSDMAKVLHSIHGKPMINYVIESVKRININDIIVVVGYQAERVKSAVSGQYDVSFCYQGEQLGTGHAVKIAMDKIKERNKQVVILCGDVPMVRETSISNLILEHGKQKWDLSLIAAKTEDPTGYGRVIFEENNRIRKIVEEKDAGDEEKQIKVINTGLYCVEREFLRESISKIKNDNKQKEYYLTDLIQIGYVDNKNIGAVLADDYKEFLGINTPEELRKAENILKNRDI